MFGPVGSVYSRLSAFRAVWTEKRKDGRVSARPEVQKLYKQRGSAKKRVLEVYLYSSFLLNVLSGHEVDNKTVTQKCSL